MTNWKEEFDKIWLETLHKSQDDMIDRMEMKVFIETQIIQKLIEEIPTHGTLGYSDGGIQRNYPINNTNMKEELKAKWLSK